MRFGWSEPEGVKMTATFTTNQSVKFHGWELPAGTVITADAIVRDGYAGCSHLRANSDLITWGIAVPTWAVVENVYESGLPITHI